VASTKTMASAVMKVFMAGLRWYLTSVAFEQRHPRHPGGNPA
jgi:hypothetical protein